MPVINLLSNEVADLIAAGEVVERPASAVKELIENSIDSGADRITVEIKNGGISFIRITDNGCGMDSKDAALCLLRHATSKLRNAQDLEEISTMGFRGEALAALCAVARIELLTKMKGEISGTKVVAEGSKIISVTETGCPEGTTVVVRDLFYNTPARQKFLKKEVTESAAVASAVDRAVLAAPNVSFTFIKDGRRELFTRGGGLEEAAREVLGRELAAKTAMLGYENAGIKITGLIGLPEAARPNRNLQFFYLNGRYIKSRVMTSALEEALKNNLLTERFPVCIIKAQVAPRTVDVNVHPAKTEVKFADDRSVYDAIFFSVKNAIFSTQQRPDFEAVTVASKPRIAVEDRGTFSTPPDAEKTLNSQSIYGGIPSSFAQPAEELRHMNAQSTFNEMRKDMPIEQPQEAVQISGQAPAFEPAATCAEPEALKPPIPDMDQIPPRRDGLVDFRLAGQLFDEYILVELADELLIIDKHAAQERIRFERLKENKGCAASQSLLLPQTVSLARNEYECVLSNLAAFERLGFELDDFGAGSVLIRGVPIDLSGEDAPSLVIEIADMIADNKKEITPALYDEIMHSIACKASVKAGMHSPDEDMNALASMILQMPDIRYCPHGRPVAMSLKKYAIDKEFKRC